MRILFNTIVLLFAAFAAAQAQTNPHYNMTRLGQLTYPGQELSSLWGYTAPDGTEYALVGTTTKLSIVSLANPAAPVEVASVAGPTTSWREVKTWGSYAYVALDNVTTGILIIDLSNLPNSVTSQYWKPTLTVNGTTTTLNKAHTVTIDNGYMYLNGSNFVSGATLIFDVNTTPGTPQYLTHVGTEYVHDCYVRNNQLWAACIYAGWFTVYDVTNKTQPITQKLAQISTPFTFTHNTWLSDDGTHLYTTDERGNSYVTAYNVSNLSNIQEVGRWRNLQTVGKGVIPHNVHVKDDYIVVAHYTDGVTILDGHRPQNLVQTGAYDTYGGTDGGFFGVWGVYPYFNSGIIIASDINTGLSVLQPSYTRACYLEGVVRDANTNALLSGVTATIQGTIQTTASTSTGAYAFGHYQSGTYTAVYSKTGYQSQSVSVQLSNGVITTQNVNLVPTSAGCTDAYEPNNSRSRAKAIGVNQDISALISSSTDADWFQFANTSATRNIKINLSNLPADYNVQLYRGSTLLATSQNTGTTAEQIIYNTTTVSSTYYVRVYTGGAFNASQCYTLRASLSGTNWFTAGGDNAAQINEENETTSWFSISPNPANSHVWVNYNGETEADVEIRIIDASAKTILLQKQHFEPGDNPVPFDLQDAPPGLYFVQIRDGASIQTQKLIRL